jgi:hypothetical protein
MNNLPSIYKVRRSLNDQLVRANINLHTWAGTARCAGPLRHGTHCHEMECPDVLPSHFHRAHTADRNQDLCRSYHLLGCRLHPVHAFGLPAHRSELDLHNDSYPLRRPNRNVHRFNLAQHDHRLFHHGVPTLYHLEFADANSGKARPYHLILSWIYVSAISYMISICICLTDPTSVIALGAVRLHALYDLALAANLTGTVEQTVFLATMELWFNALALSIPTLRPLYRQLQEKWSGSRIDRSGANSYMPNTSDPMSKRSKRNGAFTDATATYLEMDDCESLKNRSGTDDGVVGYSPQVDDASSEKNLTNDPNKIKVTTRWTISHNS